MYHVNAVDEVTQWQVVGATPQIGEQWLLPVREAMLPQFPFRIRGFHSDNGSEFINHTVAKLLNKLLVEQTKSRPRHSNDNGLVEAKNGAVIRKHIDYGYIDSSDADAIMTFYRDHFNPYLNFHRPCGVPETTTDRKGKQRRVYRRYATPWELLQEAPEFTRYLQPGIAAKQLQRKADACSDTQAARPAGSQTPALRRAKKETERMKTVAEMTGHGRRGKPTAGFPRPPQPLEIAARFPHSRSRGERWECGKPKSAFPLSHRPVIYSIDRLNKKNKEA